VDRFQFLASLIKQIPASIKLTADRICSLLFYQLSAFSHALGSAERSPEAYARFYLENGRGLSSITPFYLAVAMVENFPMTAVDSIAKGFREFEKLDSFEALFGSDLCLLLIGIANFSYFARDEEVARRWCDKRFSSQGEFALEIRNYQLDFEMRSLILPTFSEFAKKGVRLDSLRRRMTTTITAISGVSL
jgi:hypothetical protein